MWENVLYAITALVASAGLCVAYSNIRRLREERLADTDWLSVTDGWIYCDLEGLQSDPQFQRIAAAILREPAYVELFRKGHFLLKHVRNYTAEELLSHDPRTISIDKQRALTLSSLVHSFDIPIALWRFDEEVITLLVGYLDHTCAVGNLAEYVKGSRCERLAATDRTSFDSILELVPLAAGFIAKHSHVRYPNFERLVHEQSRDPQSLWFAVGEDRNQLKRLLTVTFGLYGLSIPSDYLYVDDNVVDYLTK